MSILEFPIRLRLLEVRLSIIFEKIFEYFDYFDYFEFLLKLDISLVKRDFHVIFMAFQ